MKRRVLFCFLFFAALFMTMPQASAISFDLDSIAAMGKFPRFIVNTYRWGDRFFNGYDTTYVKPTLYKFNVKTTADSWLDGYNFTLPSGGKIFMNSKPSTSFGIYATYLAVSLGYDLNVSKLFGNSDHSRKRFRFGFNCMLFAAEMYLIHNNGSSTIKRFGKYNHIKIPFYGVASTTWVRRPPSTTAASRRRVRARSIPGCRYILRNLISTSTIFRRCFETNCRANGTTIIILIPTTMPSVSDMAITGYSLRNGCSE